jgi:hypothetical protein
MENIWAMHKCNLDQTNCRSFYFRVASSLEKWPFRKVVEQRTPKLLEKLGSFSFKLAKPYYGRNVPGGKLYSYVRNSPKSVKKFLHNLAHIEAIRPKPQKCITGGQNTTLTNRTQLRSWRELKTKTERAHYPRGT